MLDLERRLCAFAARNPDAIAKPSLDLFRYAMNLAKIDQLLTPGGADIELTGATAEFRGWLIDSLRGPFQGRWGPDVARIEALRPEIGEKLERSRRRLIGHFAGQLDPAVLDNEICNKKLVLVLGGGGGSGFAHLGVFSLLADIGWDPDLIVGASMGSMLGLFRAIRKEWDPVGTLLALPRRFDRRGLFKPFGGRTRYGFPGAFFLKLNTISRLTLDLLIRRPKIHFNELEIPLEIMVTGVRLGMKSAMGDLSTRPTVVETLTGLRVRRRIKTMLKVMRTLVANPRFLAELTLGRDELSRRMSCIDAVGFSCAVPGLFCYDLSADAGKPAFDALNRLFDEYGLWGLTDGGVTSNVPARSAWESVASGTLGTRNAFVYALDPFAPQVNSNIMFLPLQQIAQLSVGANAPYADLNHSFSSPPSPVELVLGWRRAKQIEDASRAELERDRQYLELMKTPLPPYEALLAEAA